MRTPMAAPVRIKLTPSLREFRTRDTTLPRYLFTLPFDFLRGSVANPEWQTLLGFYNQRGGDFDDFLFLDATDNTCTNQAFGTGDASTTQFQLVRTVGGFAEPVYGLNGAPTLKSNGSTIASGYSVDVNGLVSFSTAPSTGVALTWTGGFFWRVRFAKGQLEINQFMRDFWEAKKVELISVRPT